jgi:hypothetical protein
MPPHRAHHLSIATQSGPLPSEAARILQKKRTGTVLTWLLIRHVGFGAFCYDELAWNAQSNTESTIRRSKYWQQQELRVRSLITPVFSDELATCSGRDDGPGGFPYQSSIPYWR